MKEYTDTTIASFKVYSSFGIPDKLQYVLLGSIESGAIEPGMFANIDLNSSLVLPMRIHEVAKIELPEDKTVDTLLIYHCTDIGTYNLFLAMNVWSETIRITLEGID